MPRHNEHATLRKTPSMHKLDQQLWSSLWSSQHSIMYMHIMAYHYTISHMYLIAFSKNVPPLRVSKNNPFNVQVLQHSWAK